MRRIRIAAVGLVLGGSLAGGGVALASSASPHITTAETIHLDEHHTKNAYVDTDNNKKPSTGDMFVFAGYLTDTSTHKRVGTIDARCIVSFGDNANCDGTLTFPGRGTVQLAGTSGAGANTEIAVTGGTGEFQNARGELDSDQVNDNYSVDTLHLIP